jgi:2-C-methyl-D-erythritol 4-phosphate cytidylyltransferase
MQEKSVIITAGGLGKRMKSTLPKQFIVLGNKPLLMHTIQLFYEFDPKIEIILALPKDWLDYWKELQVAYNFTIPHAIVIGGEERFHTVQNALEKCTGKFIAVHDGVRPFVSRELLELCFDSLRQNSAVIPVLSIKESVRFLSGNETEALDRNHYKLVHTPQCFLAEALKKAYLQPFHDLVTDDARLLEQMGEKLFFVESEEENIKVTTANDLKIAIAILASKK